MLYKYHSLPFPREDILPPNLLSPIHMDKLAGNIAGIRTGQKYVGRSHLAGLSCPPHGGILAEIGNIVKSSRNQRSPNGSRGYPIYPNLALYQILGQGSRKGHDSALGAGII